MTTHIDSRISKGELDQLTDQLNITTLDDRPTFFTDDKQPIRAAGILCYVFDYKSKNRIWLFRKQNGKFSDTGGKTSIVDKSPVDTAIRETVEETNGHLFSKRHSRKYCESILRRHLRKQRLKPIYNKYGKYLLYFFELNWYNFKLSLFRFGTKEIGNGDKEHSYHWKDIFPSRNDIHRRLIGYDIFLK